MSVRFAISLTPNTSIRLLMLILVGPLPGAQTFSLQVDLQVFASRPSGQEERDDDYENR